MQQPFIMRRKSISKFIILDIDDTQQIIYVCKQSYNPRNPLNEKQTWTEILKLEKMLDWALVDL